MPFAELTQPDVVAFLGLTDELAIVPWLTGGWGVDALLGEQTRRHADLDIVLPAAEAALLHQHLALRGFVPVPREPTAPWRFALGDAAGREIDVRLVERIAGGRLSHGPDAEFPTALLDGRGIIGTRAVRCVAAAWQVRLREAKDHPDRDDRQDVLSLCARFGLAVPPRFERPPP